MRSRHHPAVVLAIVAALALPTSGVQASTGGSPYANQTPYGVPAASVVAPPAGYQLFFVENVARHGSRSLTNDKAERRALAVWRSAARQGDLTTRGRRFDDQLRAFQAAERRVGYGNLSTIGKAEWVGIGRRTAQTYGPFLTAATDRGETVAMQTSPVYRTQQSASYLRRGLLSQVPGLRTTPRVVNDDLLIEEGSTRTGRAAIAKVLRRSTVKAAARTVLLRLYRRSFVDRLSDPVGKALDLYLLYATAPGMAGDTRATFADVVPVSAARQLAEAVDARNFYRFGPGVAGQSSSFRQARPVLDDFFVALDARIAGGTTAAVFRSAHGEVTMPFAALIRAPGSERQAPRDRAYSHASNPWRGSVAGRLGGNLEWTAFRDAGGGVLVTMRYDERPVRFNASCTSTPGHPYYYRPAELRRCLT